MEVDGSDDLPDFNWGDFEVQDALIFRGYKNRKKTLETKYIAYPFPETKPASSKHLKKLMVGWKIIFSAANSLTCPRNHRKTRAAIEDLDRGYPEIHPNLRSIFSSKTLGVSIW